MVQYEWNEQACRLYADSLRPMVKYDHAKWAVKIAQRISNVPRGAKVMDVATGPGFLLLELADQLPDKALSLIAQDGADNMMTIAREEAQRVGLEVETVCCLSEKIAMEDGSVDVVTCKQLLHECEDVGRTLREIYRVLKPGGKAFIIDFDALGSRFAAKMIKTFMRLTKGKEIAEKFWTSFSAGLPGPEVRDQMIALGFQNVEYIQSGPSYMMVGVKA